MSDTVARFTDRVENYVKYRPSYPREAIEFLELEFGLSASMTIADIGCGTGISSKPFLENGNRVIGVEPNEAMRAAAKEFLAAYPRFEIIDGRSDATNLDDESVDAIVAAQAFHWFDPEPARAEFRRILKPGGFVALIWNERQLDTTPFLVEYERHLLKYGNDYEQVRHENIGDEQIGKFFQTEFSSISIDNEQVFDLSGLLGRSLSSSYMPNESDARFGSMKEDLAALFAKHAENGRIRVLYDTRVFVSRL